MSQMSPVCMLILFQSVILRLADTESTPRLSSLAHLITLNCLNHQNQLWSFADVGLVVESGFVLIRHS